MKIVKTAKKHKGYNLQKQKANEGCMICPCCGETKTVDYYINKGKGIKGISGGIYSTQTSGLFNTKVLRVDHYVCNTCGAEWESEPYEW